jgi:hypothetical protein
MDKRIRLFAGLTALIAMGSAHAEICPGFTQVDTDINDETGHTFFLYQSTAPGITWDQAQACATGLPQQGGVSAHLATITSSSENTWITGVLLQPNLPLIFTEPTASLTQVWVGGFQDTGAVEPSEGWRWVNNEGPFPGSNGSGSYTNWAGGEPNNDGGSENHLTVGRYPDNLGGWNDEGAALNTVGGFIVEYDTPRTVGGGCTVNGSTTACTTVEGQTLTFPPGTFTGNSSFTFTAYEFTDPRVDADGRCVGILGVRGPLTLFEGAEFNLPGGQSGKLVIPEYLCGSPKFLVVRAVGTGITIPSGVVVTESNTSGILPGNLYACNNPIAGNTNPQTQDVGVWQSLDGTEMWENGTTQLSPYARFAGLATELTTGCASTVIKTKAKSNFVVGLHIDFNLPFGSVQEKTAVYNEFVALTQYKISLVRQSVVQARTSGSISKLNALFMLVKLDVAAATLANNYPVLASKAIELFLLKVKTSSYSANLANFNYNGDHLSRGENILFMLKVKIIPYKPVP